MAMVLLWSCQEKDGLGVAASGSIELAGPVTDGQLLVGPDGGDFSVNVTSSEGWRVSGFCDWVTLSSESGNSGQPLTFTVDPNEDTKSRTATFKVFSANAVQAVTITQTPTYAVTLVSDETVEVSADASLVNVNLLTNVEELDIDFGGAESWIQLGDVADAFGKKIIQFNVNRSSEFLGREAVLTIGGEGVEEAVEVTISQAQRDTAFFVYDEQKYVQGLEAISVSFVLKSNVDVTYSLPSWLTQSLGEATEKDETGLQTQTVSFTAGASAGSRSTTLTFKYGSATVGSFFLKQQNPNPVIADIPDSNLRYLLQNNGWVIQDEGTKCELLADGINATSLVVGSTSTNSYGTDPIKSIEGLENFPNLESLTLGSVQVNKVDISNFPKIKSLRLINMNYITEINTGSHPITKIWNEVGTYTYHSANRIVIKGDFIEEIDLNVIDNYYVDYESNLEYIDVTGCPKLTTLKATRYNSWGESSLKYIYMTAAQAASVQVEKLAKVEIVVK